MNFDSFSTQSTKRSTLPDYDNDDDEPHTSKRKKMARSPSPPLVRAPHSTSVSEIANSDYFQIKLPGQSNFIGSTSQSEPNTSDSGYIIYHVNNSKGSSDKSSKSAHKSSHHPRPTTNRRSEPYDVKKLHSSEKWKDRSVKSSSSSRKTSSFHESLNVDSWRDSYKCKLKQLVDSRKLSFDSMYKVRLVVDGQSFVSSDFKNAKDAEEEAFRKAYESLSKNTGTATSSSFHFDQAQILPLANNNSKNVLISEIKEIFQNQNMQTLFKSEFPSEYRKLLGKSIPDNWFDVVKQSSHLFKIEETLGRSMTTITLL